MARKRNTAKKPNELQLLGALEQAEDSTQIVSSLARYLYTKAQGEECPAGLIPTVEALEAWYESPENRRPASARLSVEAVARLYDPDNTEPVDVSPGEAQGLPKVAVNIPRRLLGKLWREHKIGNFPATVELLHTHWQLGERIAQKHPLLPVVKAWQDRPKPVEERRLIVSAPLDKQHSRFVVRAPALSQLALIPPLNALEVDGEPFASALPSVPEKRAYYRTRRQQTEQGELFPGPQRLDGKPVGDLILSSLAGYDLRGDERSPLRSDLYRLATFGYALNAAAELTEAQGVKLLTGRDSLTEPTARRFWDALELAGSLTVTINPRTHQWVRLLQTDSLKSGVAWIAPPVWWARKKQGAWRLTGSLWRPVGLGEQVSQGTQAGASWGSLHRTLSGLESHLVWSRGTMAKGKHKGVPFNVVPVRPGGPGSPVFVSWRDLLTLAGEFVEPHDIGPSDKRSIAGQRYRRRVEALRQAGYFVTQDKAGNIRPALAGDTVEMTEEVRRQGSREAGVLIRASARFCEAYQLALRDREWGQIPASRLLE